MKWFESDEIKDSIFLRTKAEITRNLRGYPYPAKMNMRQSQQVLAEVEQIIPALSEHFQGEFQKICLDTASRSMRNQLMEEEIIYDRPRNDVASAVFLFEDETFAVVVNDRDHLRFTSVHPREYINLSVHNTTEAEEIGEDYLDYAYDMDLGYLSPDPCRLGSGFWTSVLVHVEALDMAGKSYSMFDGARSAGLRIDRLHFGTGIGCGSFYNIRTGISYTKTDEELVEFLRRFIFVLKQEEEEVQKEFATRLDIQDRMARSYGLLQHARNLVLQDAANLISQTRLGYQLGVLYETRPKISLVNLLYDIHPERLRVLTGIHAKKDKIDCLRADYIRQQFGEPY